MKQNVKIRDDRKAVFYIRTKDPYGDGREIFKSSTPTIHPGITFLVGGNGVGKSAMIKCMKDALDAANYKYFSYDNLSDGRQSLSGALSNNNYNLATEKMLSSEGENIIINIAHCMKDICDYGDSMAKEKKPIFIFLDAVDSGLSIDNIRGVKWFLHELCHTRWERYNCYIITTANTYEMVKDEELCYNIRTASYTCFPTYEKYSAFIMRTRKSMDKYIEKYNKERG